MAWVQGFARGELCIDQDEYLGQGGFSSSGDIMLCTSERLEGRRAVSQLKTPLGFYEIIVSPDGTYRIARNGETINALEWPEDQLEHCERLMNQLAGADIVVVA